MKSRLYIYFSIIQIMIAVSIIVYVMSDYKVHFRELWVLHMELLMGVLMLVDVLIYTVALGFKIECLVFVEWAAITGFIGLYIFLSVRGINALEEELELLLMAARVALQIVRLLLAFARIKEVKDKRSATNPIEWCEKSNSNEASNTRQASLAEN